MKTKCLLNTMLGVGILVACLTSASALTSTNGVFLLMLSGSGVLQDDVSGIPVMQKIKVTDMQLINLAMGRGVNAPRTVSQVLALAVDVEANDGWIMVYDPIQSSNLVTVATVYDGSHVGSLKGGMFMLSLDVQSVGSMSNGIDQGNLMLCGKYGLANGAVNKVSATINGFFHLVITDDVGTHDVEMVLQKGKLKIGPKIGEIVAP